MDEPRSAGKDGGEPGGGLLVALAQKVREVRIDCDADALLLRVEQVGGIACHTGRESCFFRKLQNGRWVATDPVLKDPSLIYKK